MIKRDLTCERCDNEFQSRKELSSETDIQDDQAQCGDCGSRNCVESKK